jgi:hypothetical protein
LSKSSKCRTACCCCCLNSSWTGIAGGRSLDKLSSYKTLQTGCSFER